MKRKSDFKTASATQPKDKKSKNDADVISKPSSSESTTFADFHLKPELLSGILSHGFKTPAAIQAQGIPPIIAGKDVIAQAQSGSGKTATFCIGLLQRLQILSPAHTQALILVPTRELALQIQQVLQSLGSHMCVRCTCCYGGKSENMKHTIQLLNNGQHVVVATPGRVLDLIRRGHITTKHISMLILDEADEMFAMGLKEQLEKIRGLLPSGIQLIMLSATLPSDALQVVDEYMNNPVRILIHRKQQNVSKIAQYYLKTDEDEWKFECLVDILKALPHKALAVIFCNTRQRVENLHKILRREAQKAPPFPSVCLTHGDMEQKARQLVMKQFFSREKHVLICTDLWARGMDVQELDLVINFDFPQTHELYIHRVGRTGRYGKSGLAISLVTADEFKRLVNIQTRFQIPMSPVPAVLKKLFEQHISNK